MAGKGQSQELQTAPPGTRALSRCVCGLSRWPGGQGENRQEKTRSEQVQESWLPEWQLLHWDTWSRASGQSLSRSSSRAVPNSHAKGTALQRPRVPVIPSYPGQMAWDTAMDGKGWDGKRRDRVEQDGVVTWVGQQGTEWGQGR